MKLYDFIQLPGPVNLVISVNMCQSNFREQIFFLSFFRIKQLLQSSPQLTFGSIAEICSLVNEDATMPRLDKVLKTQELAPGPDGPWVPLYPGGPGGPAGPRLVPLTPGGPMILVLLRLFFTKIIKIQLQ